MDTAQNLSLTERLPDRSPDADRLLEVFLEWTMDQGIELYPAQEEAVLEVFAGKHVILNTPTGSGKSLVAIAQHFYSFALGGRSYYTSPIKALVNEKFFALCEVLGPQNVGLMTGDATVNKGAAILCCTAEILAALALTEGEHAQIHSAVMDEFHYYGDRDRGMAWQIPLLTLPQASFLLMSATLGDPSFFGDRLQRTTGRDVAIVRSATRPVPLEFQYSTHRLIEKIEELATGGLTPVYVVNFTQRNCAELAQSLMSLNVCTKEEKKVIARALASTKFNTPFGKTIRKFLAHGVAIHHAGLLPRYRSLVERLAQQGLLKVICGTDTLGVGINVPIRTVLFTKLCKFDGQKTRLLSVRDFKQIAGRAGRKGFDTAGLVVCQAPEHVIENLKMAAKAAGDPKKKKKMVRKKPPERGYAHWDEATFKRLIESDSETLVSRFNVTHGMLVNLLQSGHGYAGLLSLIDKSHESDRAKERLREKAEHIFESLKEARILEVSTSDDDDPMHATLAPELQTDFSIHHELSLFLIHAVGRLDPSDEAFHLKAAGFTESILEDPRIVLLRQQDSLRREAYAAMKMEGVEYEERQERLEKITWPMPDSELIFDAFDRYAEDRPWIAGKELRPKSVARDMYEKYASFNDYVNEYRLEQSEGVLLRYLNQAYKTLVQNIPEMLRDDALHDMIAYLREAVATTDSSLFDTWLTMQGKTTAPVQDEGDDVPVPIDQDLKSFRARVRAELRSLVSALAKGEYDSAADRVHQGDEVTWTAAQFEDALAPFFNEHDRLVYDHGARAAHFTTLTRTGPGQWTVIQVLCDGEQENNWHLRGRIDLTHDPIPTGPLLRLETISP